MSLRYRRFTPRDCSKCLRILRAFFSESFWVTGRESGEEGPGGNGLAARGKEEDEEEGGEGGAIEQASIAGRADGPAHVSSSDAAIGMEEGWWTRLLAGEVKARLGPWRSRAEGRRDKRRDEGNSEERSEDGKGRGGEQEAVQKVFEFPASAGMVGEVRGGEAGGERWSEFILVCRCLRLWEEGGLQAA